MSAPAPRPRQPVRPGLKDSGHGRQRRSSYRDRPPGNIPSGSPLNAPPAYAGAYYANPPQMLNSSGGARRGSIFDAAQPPSPRDTASVRTDVQGEGIICVRVMGVKNLRLPNGQLAMKPYAKVRVGAHAPRSTTLGVEGGEGGGGRVWTDAPFEFLISKGLANAWIELWFFEKGNVVDEMLGRARLAYKGDQFGVWAPIKTGKDEKVGEVRLAVGWKGQMRQRSNSDLSLSTLSSLGSVVRTAPSNGNGHFRKMSDTSKSAKAKGAGAAEAAVAVADEPKDSWTNSWVLRLAGFIVAFILCVVVWSTPKMEGDFLIADSLGDCFRGTSFGRCNRSEAWRFKDTRLERGVRRFIFLRKKVCLSFDPPGKGSPAKLKLASCGGESAQGWSLTRGGKLGKGGATGRFCVDRKGEGKEKALARECATSSSKFEVWRL
ncbi:unnamed protein product [Chrysoparadoxa australica]